MYKLNKLFKSWLFSKPFQPPVCSRHPRISEPSGDAEDIAVLPPEEREKRKSFECKRKQHYNEFQAVKMARALMDEDNSEVRVEVRVMTLPSRMMRSLVVEGGAGRRGRREGRAPRCPWRPASEGSRLQTVSSPATF